MKYISLFSGVGGLEMSDPAPEYLCDSDPDCETVLSRCYPDTPIYPDVNQVPDIRADICLAGWPCQDLTSAGRQAGIYGTHSSLFFRAVNITALSGAHTFVGENVPNLLRLRKGDEFKAVLSALCEAGFPYISWRTLNAQNFGLPQDRERIIVVASKILNIAYSLHRSIFPVAKVRNHNEDSAAGFYWTGGQRSICYSSGYVPALKVGASPPKGGTSPVAVFYNSVVRKLSAIECVTLQGLKPEYFEGLITGSVFRMAGNAVSRPVGRFAADTAAMEDGIDLEIVETSKFEQHGLIKNGEIYYIRHDAQPSARNLGDFLDFNSRDSLSNQAAAGLLVRAIRAQKPFPLSLYDALYKLSTVRTKLRGTKIDSFKILHEQLDPGSFREFLSRQQNLELRFT
jgi:DNA (cytosine-5)-methyltransferase 1